MATPPRPAHRRASSSPFKLLVACFPHGLAGKGDPGADIVPYDLQNSLLLHDKLVEAPPATAKSPAQTSFAESSTSSQRHQLSRHELVLMQHRQAPPRVVEWLELKDTDSNRVFYHNKMTGKSVWEKPEGFDEAVSIAAREEEKRGSYFIQVEDSKGRKYYYDLITKETRWDKPAAFVAPPAPQDNSARQKRASSRYLREELDTV